MSGCRQARSEIPAAIETDSFGSETDSAVLYRCPAAGDRVVTESVHLGGDGHELRDTCEMGSPITRSVRDRQRDLTDG